MLIIIMSVQYIYFLYIDSFLRGTTELSMVMENLSAPEKIPPHQFLYIDGGRARKTTNLKV